MDTVKKNIAIDETRRVVKGIFSKMDLSDAELEVLVDALLDAELRGIKSHGLSRVQPYYERMVNGALTIPGNMEKLTDHNATALYDGNNSIGQWCASEAMREAIEKAEKFGIGAVSVRNSNHFGTAGYFAKLAAERDMIGIVFTNASPRLAPWGGTEKLFGNNPWSIAIPTHKPNIPFVMDIANSVTSAGKIRNALKNKEEIPGEWALDKNGNPTTDPEEALSGILLPFGQHKGYGITFAISVLTSLLSGGEFDSEVNSVDHKDRKQNVSHFFISINISYFQDVEVFKQRMESLIQKIHESGRVPCADKIYYPGERGYTSKLELLNSGEMTIKESLWNYLQMAFTEGVKENRHSKGGEQG